MLYVYLDELPDLYRRGIISNGRSAAVSVRRTDHTDFAGDTWAQAVRNEASQKLGILIEGRVALLTQWRSFGFYFSPLNLFYCYNKTGEHLVAMIAEVSNIPWMERHLYFHDLTQSKELKHPKQFHVSPFWGMDMIYSWKISFPNSSLAVEIVNEVGDQSVFTAELLLKAEPLTRENLRSCLLRPWRSTAGIVGSIYTEAFKLWKKKCPYFPHPHRLPIEA